MKIIHCADLHLDSKLTANLSKEKARERRAELLQTFIDMVEYAKKNNVSAVIIAGDLFDVRNISVTARNTVYSAILNHKDIDFYYLKGNHDADSFLGMLEEIPQNLKLFSENWTSYTLSENGCADVVITGAELSTKNANTIYSSLVLDNDKINIVILHGQESSYSSKDKAEVININALRNKGIDYLALGHIHSYKEEKLDNRGVFCYSGCLEGRGFDECGQCGFVLLETDSGNKKLERTFVPFAKRNLYTVNIDISGCKNSMEILNRVKSKLDMAGYGSESLLKLVLCGQVDVECEKNTDFIRKQFEDMYYFVKVYDETVFEVDYSAFALDASLKGEFIRTVLSEENLSDEKKAEVIRYGIQALAGEEMD
jgi:DNA repair exonuclease SbcCD nuclease subunit